jgi:hypothetical protein
MGAATGTLSFNAVSCASAGGISIALAGRTSGGGYGVTIQTQRSGSFTFANGTTQGTVPLVQLSEQPVGGTPKVWSAGFQQAPGSGSITVNSDNSGSIDADLQASPGTTGTVHVKGSWKCS